ncbi:MAG: energy-coupled thiamine transporter ThiT [Clostridia bacterium]|jgi:thiamine transporter|nr:energy-coupled thiamine transporter ThiT [Clostridia bacterium]MBR2346618.1 energy-coupled thiamine transporter ThiT [Clostridia bacterium]
MKRTEQTKRLTTSAVMLALAMVLAMVCALIPFLNLPFGGGFTVASMLPVVIISYMYGMKWGFFSAAIYSVIQIVMDLYLGKGSTIMALFMPNSEDFMGFGAAIAILIIDYLVAYTLLGFGGAFRKVIKNKALALTLGVVLALSLRYIAHIVSGYIFYGAWAEWFFSQENFYAIGGWILEHFSGNALAVIYSIFYNGLYMIPEIVITAVAALIVGRLPVIKMSEVE